MLHMYSLNTQHGEVDIEVERAAKAQGHSPLLSFGRANTGQ